MCVSLTHALFLSSLFLLFGSRFWSILMLLEISLSFLVSITKFSNMDHSEWPITDQWGGGAMGRSTSFEIRLTFETALPTISQMNFNVLLYNTINFMSSGKRKIKDTTCKNIQHGIWKQCPEKWHIPLPSSAISSYRSYSFLFNGRKSNPFP